MVLVLGQGYGGEGGGGEGEAGEGGSGHVCGCFTAITFIAVTHCENALAVLSANSSVEGVAVNIGIWSECIMHHTIAWATSHNNVHKGRQKKVHKEIICKK